ncbi:MAG: hypothetical protein AB7F35_23190 [Acetobacteraceae bacterium]
MYLAEVVLPTLPKGLSFEVSHHLLMQAWAEGNGLRLEIRQDHGAGQEEYEEVVAVYDDDSSLCRCLIWRDAESVFVQPLVGRTQRHASVPEALESLLPESPVVVDDIVATYWPRA